MSRPPPTCVFAVVVQSYFVTVMDEHVLHGNAGILKCHIPSFVADFVSVIGWQEDDDADDDNGDDGNNHAAFVANGVGIFNVLSNICSHVVTRTYHRQNIYIHISFILLEFISEMSMCFFPALYALPALFIHNVFTSLGQRSNNI